MKIKITIVLYLFSIVTMFSQNIETKIVFEDNYDNILGIIEDLYFDEDGNFFFLTNSKANNFFVINHDSFPLPKRKNGTATIYGKHGEVSTYYTTKDSFYYKNKRSIKYFHGGYGKVIKQITDFKNDNIGITTEKDDTIFQFLNGKLLTKNLRDSLNVFPRIDKWCSFSENGNTLYYYRKASMYYLYKNSTLIDSANTRFIELQINNEGDIFYGIGKEGIPDTKFDYMFFPKYNEIKFDSVRTIWNSIINQKGGFYCSGGNPTYFMINGKYFENQRKDELISPNSKYFFFYENKRRGSIYFTNDSKKSFRKKKIIFPSMDDEGNLSMFLKSRKKVEILKNGEINTKEIIGNPLSINPNGEYYSYLLKKKTTEIYHNNNLIIKERGEIRIKSKEQVFKDYLNQYSVNKKSDLGIDFAYFEIGLDGYIIWNGKISTPIKKISEKTFSNKHLKNGELLHGEFNEHGFFIFQYDGDRKTKLILNNKIYVIEDEIDSIIEDSIFFNKNEFIFYAIIKNRVKRFIIKKEHGL